MNAGIHCGKWCYRAFGCGEKQEEGENSEDREKPVSD
jgi:hypothetical protein